MNQYSFLKRDYMSMFNVKESTHCNGHTENQTRLDYFRSDKIGTDTVAPPVTDYRCASAQCCGLMAHCCFGSLSLLS